MPKDRWSLCHALSEFGCAGSDHWFWLNGQTSTVLIGNHLMQYWYSDLWSIVSGSSKSWNIVHLYSKEWIFSYFPFRSNIHLLQKPIHHPFKFINDLQHMWAKLFKGDSFSALTVMKRLYLDHLLTAEQATAHSAFCLLQFTWCCHQCVRQHLGKSTHLICIPPIIYSTALAAVPSALGQCRS